jgi:hypothetical protein
MPMLADTVDAVIGVDTHTDTHTAAVLSPLGAHLATVQVTADAAGYAQLMEAAAAHARAALADPAPAAPRAGDTREALRIMLTADSQHDTRARTAAVNTFRALILTGPRGPPRRLPRRRHRPPGHRRPGPGRRPRRRPGSPVCRRS